MNIRRLDPQTDTALYRTAWQWTADAPQWMRDCAKVFEAADEATYLTQAANPYRVDVGIFTPHFSGMITLILRAKGVYEAYLACERGSSLDHLFAALNDVKRTLTASNMRQTFVWIAFRNHAILALCEAAGFTATGLEMYRGASHGRPIRWRQLAYVNNV